MNSVDGVIERSLHLSCPEAARLVITDPAPLRLIEVSGDDPSRLGGLGKIDASSAVNAKAARRLLTAVLQNREYPMTRRLIALGKLCGQLQERGALPEGADITALTAGVEALPVESRQRFETIVQMILRRLGSAFTTSRFLDCYREFMQGLQWVAESQVADVVARHHAAFAAYYQPFFDSREYVLENFVVSYLFRNLFPFGSQRANREFSVYNFENSIGNQYRLLIAHYLIVETMLVGMAAFRKKNFGMEHVIKLIQASAKTFEHSVTFPGHALGILDENGFGNAISMSALLCR